MVGTGKTGGRICLFINVERPLCPKISKQKILNMAEVILALTWAKWPT